jgi:hypothetical protein
MAAIVTAIPDELLSGSLVYTNRVIESGPSPNLLYGLTLNLYCFPCLRWMFLKFWVLIVGQLCVEFVNSFHGELSEDSP